MSQQFVDVLEDDSEGRYLIDPHQLLAIAVAAQINQIDRGNEAGIVDRLIQFYLDKQDWQAQSNSDIRPAELEYLDRNLAALAGENNTREAILSNCLRVLRPDTWDNDEVAVEWLDKDDEPGLIAIARADGSDRAYARDEASIPPGWVLTEKIRLKSPGQMELEIK